MNNGISIHSVNYDTGKPKQTNRNVNYIDNTGKDISFHSVNYQYNQNNDSVYTVDYPTGYPKVTERTVTFHPNGSVSYYPD